MVSRCALSHNFNESPEFYAIEDFLFLGNLLINNCKFYLVKDCLVEYFVDENSASGTTSRLNHLRKIYVIFHLILKNRKVKINNIILLYVVVRELIKYIIKEILKHKNLPK